MTQPAPMGIEIGHDGQCVTFQVRTTGSLFMFGLTPEQAESMAVQLPQGLRDAAENLKRANSGLVLPNDGRLVT